MNHNLKKTSILHTTAKEKYSYLMNDRKIKEEEKTRNIKNMFQDCSSAVCSVSSFGSASSISSSILASFCSSTISANAE